MAAKIEITFEDGGTVEVELRMPLMVQAERHFKGEIPPLEGTLWACWKKLAPGMPFEQWMDTVENMVTAADGEAAAPLVEEPAPDS